MKQLLIVCAAFLWMACNSSSGETHPVFEEKPAIKDAVNDLEILLKETIGVRHETSSGNWFQTEEIKLTYTHPKLKIYISNKSDTGGKSTQTYTFSPANIKQVNSRPLYRNNSAIARMVIQMNDNAATWHLEGSGRTISWPANSVQIPYLTADKEHYSKIKYALLKLKDLCKAEK